MHMENGTSYTLSAVSILFLVFRWRNTNLLRDIQLLHRKLFIKFHGMDGVAMAKGTYVDAEIFKTMVTIVFGDAKNRGGGPD